MLQGGVTDSVSLRSIFLPDVGTKGTGTGMPPTLAVFSKLERPIRAVNPRKGLPRPPWLNFPPFVYIYPSPRCHRMAKMP